METPEKWCAIYIDGVKTEEEVERLAKEQGRALFRKKETKK